MASNPNELAYAQARYDIENSVQRYVQEETNCPWLRLTVNPLLDSLEVWFDQPGREKYLVTTKQFMGDMQLGQLISHIRRIDSSNETLSQKVERLDKQNEAKRKAEIAAYVDRQMPAAEKVYFEAYRQLTGLKGTLY